MLLNRQTRTYRLRLTLDLIGEEMERESAADRELLQGLLRMARADASALGEEASQRAGFGVGEIRANASPKLRLVHGGRDD